ncbi:MAG: acetate uptake transporter [Syntrophotaleaceae bacterium]
MTANSPSVSYLEMPFPALLGFAVSLLSYILSQLDFLRPPLLLTGIVLISGAVVQLIYGIHSRQNGHKRNAAILLPFGIFWLSLVGYQVFPGLGIGRHPGAVTMFSFMSLWGIFAAILFLSSFRSNTIVQVFFGALMASLLSLSMYQLRDHQVFLILGCFFGILSSLSAVYIALAQAFIQRLQRSSEYVIEEIGN